MQGPALFSGAAVKLYNYGENKVTLPEKEDSIQLISFNIGRKLFGIDIMTIREILRDPKIEVLGKAPAFIEGVVRVRGEVIPVVDLKRRLGGAEKTSQGDNQWLMITNVASYLAGFVVDKVTRILKIEPDTIMAAPDLIFGGSQRPYIRGVCESEMGMLVVLDFARLLSADEIHELKKIDVR